MVDLSQVLTNFKVELALSVLALVAGMVRTTFRRYKIFGKCTLLSAWR